MHIENNSQQAFNWQGLKDRIAGLRTDFHEQLDEAVVDAILSRRAQQLAATQADATEQVQNDYLIFSLGNESYAIELKYIQEVTALPLITRLPGVPPFIAGIISR